MKKFSIEEIKVGMVPTSTVYSIDNQVVLRAGEVIKEADYNRLIRWGIRELYSEGDFLDNDSFQSLIEYKINEEKNFVKIYNQITEFFKQIYNDIVEKLKCNINSLNILSQRVIDLALNYKNQIISYALIFSNDYSYPVTHLINTAIISAIGAKEFSLSELDMKKLVIASLLHDIGMSKVPLEILNKKSKLTEEEYKIIKSHPIDGYKILKECNFEDQDILNAILQHHEQYNGNGYPRKLAKDKISIFARFIAVSDAFEAQISYRSYRKSLTGYLAMKNVLIGANTRFDPDILKAFVNAFSIYPPGSIVQLNNGCVGTVVEVNQNALLRPKIKLLIDESGNRLTKDVVKDLKKEEELFIVRVFEKDELIKI